MSSIDIATKRKLREMGAAALLDALDALDAQNETLSLGLGFDERIRLVVDEATPLHALQGSKG